MVEVVRPAVVGRPVVVARAGELDRLHEALELALIGQGQLRFVIGDAGAGKSTLLTEFAARAQASAEEVVVAVGACDAQTGSGDAYLPFREILGLLAGDLASPATSTSTGSATAESTTRLKRVMSVSRDAIVELGPDLIDVLVPGAGILARASGFVGKKAGLTGGSSRSSPTNRPKVETIDQAQIFEQYINVLRRLAEQTPLVIVLDDLHWADPASLGLLFRLGRRLEGARIMVIGTYRPNDVALGRDGERHPLEPVVTEMKRYHGDIEIDLDQAREDDSRAFVDAFLDLEPNRLGTAFRTAMQQHTGGHPLFTVEMLRNLQERGDLVRDADGAWVPGPRLDWDELPSRVEGVLEERIARVSEEIRRRLTVAAVEGEQFTAEVVAAVDSVDLRELVQQLSADLQKRHRLLKAEGVARVAGQRLSRYRFAHNLMQAYLYGSLDEVQASFLHEDVGNALEQMYGAEADSICVQLAWHFEAAGASQKALHYLQCAGEQAAARFANAEAVDFLGRALALVPNNELQRRYELLLAREDVLGIQGARAGQAADLESLAQLAEALADPERKARVGLRRAQHASEVGNYAVALTFAAAAAEAAESLGLDRLFAEAQVAAGRVHQLQARYPDAREAISSALAVAQAQGLTDIEAQCASYLGIVADLSGDRTGSRTFFEQALALYRQLGNRRREARALSNLGVSLWRAGDMPGAIGCWESSMQVDRTVGDRSSVAISLGNLAMAHHSLEDFDAARSFAEQSIPISRDVNSPYTLARVLGILGSIHLATGRYRDARAANEEGLVVDRQVGDRQDAAYRVHILGHIATDLGQLDGARSLYDEALAIAREIGDRDVEQHSLAGLARLLHRAGDLTAAREEGERSRALAETLDSSIEEANVRGILGDIYADLGERDLARREFERAIELIDRRPFMPLAGLARLELAAGHGPGAMAHLAPVIEELFSTGLHPTVDLLRVAMACVDTLELVGDSRAADARERVRTMLDQLLSGLSDEERRSFFESAPRWLLDGELVNR